MTPLDALFAPFGATLTLLEAAGVLGWSAADTADLFTASPTLRDSAATGVSAEALRQFLLQHRVIVYAQPFTPSRAAGLPPLRQILSKVGEEEPAFLPVFNRFMVD